MRRDKLPRLSAVAAAALMASGAQAFFCKDSIQGLLAQIEATTTG